MCGIIFYKLADSTYPTSVCNMMVSASCLRNTNWIVSQCDILILFLQSNTVIFAFLYLKKSLRNESCKVSKCSDASKPLSAHKNEQTVQTKFNCCFRFFGQPSSWSLIKRTATIGSLYRIDAFCTKMPCTVI